MLEECCALWQILQRVSGPSLQQQLSEDKEDVFSRAEFLSDVMHIKLLFAKL